jgi:CO/xanthine dehydrogenase FAD-binding subunit
MVNVAALVTLGEAGTVDEARVVVGATGGRPADHSASAGPFVGEPVDERMATELGRRVAEEAEIGPSSHAGAEYRREMVGVLVKRAVIAAAAEART